MRRRLPRGERHRLKPDWRRFDSSHHPRTDRGLSLRRNRSLDMEPVATLRELPPDIVFAAEWSALQRNPRIVALNC